MPVDVFSEASQVLLNKDNRKPRNMLHQSSPRMSDDVPTSPARANKVEKRIQAEGKAAGSPGTTQLHTVAGGGPRARGSRGSRQGEQVTLNKRAGVQRCSGARVKAPKYALPRELEPVGRTQASSPLGAHAPATQRVGSMGQRGSLDARAMGADAPDVPTPGRRKAGLVLERQGASGPTR